MGSGISNITILIGRLVKGGAEKQSLLLARALSAHYRIRYVVLRPGKIDASYLHYLRDSRLDFDILRGNLPHRLIRLIRLLRASRTDLLFSYLPGDNLAGTLAGKFAGVSHIVGGVRNTKIIKRKFYLLRYVQNHFQEYVIYNSSRAMEIFCSKGYRRDKAVVIENAFADQLDFFKRPENDPVRILMVGRFVWQKDYLTGIRAVAGLTDLVTAKKIRLILAGYGAMEHQVRNWISAHGLLDISEVHIQPDNLQELFRSSDIYLNSSIHEGFSNAVLEAMGHGLPVVATKCGDIEKQVAHGKSGYIAPVGNHELLGEVLELLCRDHAARLKFGREGHQRLYASYGPESFKQKYIHFIQSLK